MPSNTLRALWLNTSLIFMSLIVTTSQAAILTEAKVEIKIPLAKKSSTRPMTIAYVPDFKRYYIADGGLAPMPGNFDITTSLSEIHSYDSKGQYMQSAQPGYDNRSLYYNKNTKKLETVTYNVSSDAGFLPNTGIFSIALNDKGDITGKSDDVFGYNPAFGDAATMPTYNPDTKQYYAKQERSNKVFVVDLASREKVAEILLDLTSAKVAFDDLTDHYVAFTGVKGEEFAMLDVDHKAVVFFDLTGKYIGKSELPKTMKLRAQNHLNGLGFTNGLMFVFHEPEGEFGTYYGFKVNEPNQ